MTQLLVSVAGIALTIAVAFALGFRRNPVIAGTEEAARIVADALPGFRARSAQVGDDGRSAIVDGQDGQVAVIAAVGDRWAVRLQQ